MPPIPASSMARTTESRPPSSPSFPPITLWVQRQPSPLSRSSERFTRMSHFFRRSLWTISRAVRPFCIGRRARDIFWSTCCRGRSSAGMGGGHGHVSFRANLGRAGRRQRHHHQKRQRCRTGARACRPDHERDKLSETQGSLTDAEVARLPAHYRLLR
jgi:hypothetical protein